MAYLDCGAFISICFCKERGGCISVKLFLKYEDLE